MNNTNCGAGHPVFVNLCTLPAGHPGYHGDGDISWTGPVTRTGRRLDLPTVSTAKYDGSRPGLADVSRCGVKTTLGGYRCAKPAGHAGFHETSGGYQWRRSIDYDAGRYSCGKCGLTFPDQFGADQCCAKEPAHCLLCWDVETQTRPREQWKFAGREHTSLGHAFYVWHLLNPDGSVNSAWTHPVEAMRGRSWVEAREGE